MDKELCYMPALEMAEAIKKREISCIDVVDTILERIEKINPKINAYCTVLTDEAHKAAEEADKAVKQGKHLGPLHGVPVSIKDLIFTKGIRTTFGSKIFENFIPERDAIVVKRLKAAGAVILGKTNTPEFGYKAVTDNLLFGVTRNPWNLNLTSGGSSGGAGAAVAAGLGPMAVGSDGGGSIRIPSSFCGIFGFKPSFGRIPRYPVLHGWETLSHYGPMTRTVKDAALMLDVMAGPHDADRLSLPNEKVSYLKSIESKPKELKVAWSIDLGYAMVDPQVRTIVEKAVKVFESLDWKLEEVHPSFGDPEPTFTTMVLAETAAALIDAMGEWGDKIDPPLARLVEYGKDVSAMDYVKATFQRKELWEKVYRFFKKYDLLLTPTLAVPPFAIEEGMGPRVIDGKEASILGWMAFTFPFNLTGQPAASVPCGWTREGLPVGLQIVGRRFDDVTVLQAAAAFEEASPWAQKRPSID
jgi:aspartyl-tRNA(Asn)/glutamyl-tRNA(Gln) amidotransferase subunit A